jgi:short subunit dehydrogenase-like uncharacterized protein
MADRKYDIVVLGATGFTGRLVVEYLARTYGTGGTLRWGIAGRNREKLEAVRAELAPASGRNKLLILTADSHDTQSLEALAAATRVVCTTVGPYALHGTPLVAACVRQGTHYCDLTGEVQWMAKVIPLYQADAEASGARIVHTCGFDSIPSDIGTWFLQQAMLERHGVPAVRVKARIGRNRGSASGGTVASLLNVLEEAQHDRSVRRIIGDPYALYPAGQPAGPDRNDQNGARYDSDFRQWTAPFIMAAINTRVVRRSNALLGFPYGEHFRYDESVLTGDGIAGHLRALGLAGASGFGMLAMAVPPTRKLLARFLPEPGEGPSREQREAGYYEIFFHGKHPSDRDKDLRARVSADLDPGYGSTSRMLAESAVCLAQDTLTTGGGFWTPASAMGAALLARLQERAGISFELLEPPYSTGK